MDIPDLSNEKWAGVISGEISYEFNFFPLKLLVARQRLEMITSSSPETTNKCINELREMFVRNENLPNVQKDLKQIFKQKKSIWKRFFGGK